MAAYGTIRAMVAVLPRHKLIKPSAFIDWYMDVSARLAENGTSLAKEGREKLGTNAMKRVAAGAHLPNPWLFEPAKHPDDRTDNSLGCSSLVRIIP